MGTGTGSGMGSGMGLQPGCEAEMGTWRGRRTGPGMGTGTGRPASQGPGLGKDGAGDPPAQLASPHGAVLERWLSPISAVTIEAKAADMNAVLPCP